MKSHPGWRLRLWRVAQGELILYGHCVGSALAVETAYCLGRAQIGIKAVFLGGILPPVRKGPLGRYYDPWRIISDRGIIKFLGRIGLPDVQVSESHLKQIIRAFRHDVRNYYNYFHEYANCHPDKLAMPVYCVIGDRDSTTRQYERKYLKWSCMTAQIALRVLKNADHYFIKTHADELAELLADPDQKGDRFMSAALLNPGFILTNLSLIFLVFIFIVVVKMKGKSQIHYAFLFLMSTTFIWAVGAIIMEYEFLNGAADQPLGGIAGLCRPDSDSGYSPVYRPDLCQNENQVIVEIGPVLSGSAAIDHHGYNE